MKFTIDINDQAVLNWLTLSMESYNAELNQGRSPVTIEEYISFLIADIYDSEGDLVL